MMVLTQLLPSMYAGLSSLHPLWRFEFSQLPEVPIDWLVIIFGVLLYFVLAIFSILIWAFVSKRIFKRTNPKQSARTVNQRPPARQAANAVQAADMRSADGATADVTSGDVAFIDGLPADSSSIEVSDEPFGLQLVLDSGEVFTFTDLPITIGRSEQNDLALEDESISANHARIIFDELTKMICIIDLGSLNGLFINDMPTTKNILRDGARIRLGSVPLVFRNTGYLPPDNA